jgi:phosphoglycolate phosphatase
LKPDGLIFDLDGTLWNASKACAMAWNKALDNIDIKDFRVTEQAVASYAGKLLKSIFEEYFKFLPPDRYDELAASFAEEEAYHMKTYGGELYPGVRDTLTRLAKEYPLFIVSNCLEGYIENFLEMHSLASLFTDHECSGRTGRPKNENIKSIIDRNTLKDPVYIGDTKGDFDAAKKNDLPFIFAAYGFGTVTDPDFIIDDFNSLRNLFNILQ